MAQEATKIGFILLPKLTQLDLTGPLAVFARMPDADISLLWKAVAPVTAHQGLTMPATHRFADCAETDVICVLGGPAQIECMDDSEVLKLLASIAPYCQLVTSVCTGSLILAAAGLLTAGLLSGYRATSHWSSLDEPALLGAEPVPERVVRDRNRITGAGVTSGIDFALTVVGELLGLQVTQEIELQMKYDPEPPYLAGSPRSALATLVQATRAKIAPFLAQRRAATERAAAQLASSPLQQNSASPTR